MASALDCNDQVTCKALSMMLREYLSKKKKEMINK